MYLSRLIRAGLLGVSLICLTASAPPCADTVIYTREGERFFKLEVAADRQTRTVGLMKRNDIGPYDGMLFLFPKPGDVGFWMKDTRMPLDVLFIGPGSDIVHIAENTTPYSLAIISAGTAVIAAIELDGGRASRESIAVGDIVRYELPDHVTVE